MSSCTRPWDASGSSYTWRKHIQEAKKLVAWCAIHQGVDTGQRIWVIQASFIQICEVDAHPPLVIGLLDQYYIGQPLGILDLPYVVSIQQHEEYGTRCICTRRRGQRLHARTHGDHSLPPTSCSGVESWLGQDSGWDSSRTYSQPEPIPGWFGCVASKQWRWVNSAHTS